MVKTSSHGGYFTFEISLRLQRVQSGGQILCFYKSRFSTIFLNAARTGESSGRRTVGFSVTVIFINLIIVRNNAKES